MNHFSYPLAIAQINIFEEPQNIFFRPKSQTPNYRASPPPPEFLIIECLPGLTYNEVEGKSCPEIGLDVMFRIMFLKLTRRPALTQVIPEAVDHSF